MIVTGTPATEPVTEHLSPVRLRRFTLAEYHKMIEAGILGADERVELLAGEIVQMSPQDKPHARAIARLNRWFAQALGDEYVVRPQLPLSLSDSEPEPDLAIVRTVDEVAAERHPGAALLVIEVADSSARHDLLVKSEIYASAGIPEYWLVLGEPRVVEVFRDPDPAARSYRTRLTLSGHENVAPLAFGGPVISVQALFG